MVTASEMGKKGGSVKSEAKAAAARKNASKPRGKWVTAIAYQLAGVKAPFAFGLVVVKGKSPTGSLKHHEWVCEQVLANGVGLSGECSLEFRELMTTSMRV